MIELACALLGIWAAFASPGLLGLTGAILAWQLVLISVIDAEHLWLPDRLTGALALTGLLAAVPFGEDELAHRAIGLAAGFLSLWLMRRGYCLLRRREGLGGGDPKLFGAIGAWVGWTGLPSVLVVASVVGLLTAFLWRPRSDARLPLGTFLALGAWLVWIFGPMQIS